MGLPVVLLPGLVQILPHYKTNPDTGEKPLNVLWFVQRAPVSLTQANMTTIANQFDTLWPAVWKGWGSSNAQYLGCVATDYSTPFGQQWDTRGIVTPTSGTGGSGLPANVALLISMHVNERWRGGHPRIYLPWGAEASINVADPDTATAAVVAGVNTAFGALEPGMNSIAVGGGLSQRIYRQRTSPTNAHLLPISTFTVNSMLATQRRRMRKVPHH